MLRTRLLALPFFGALVVFATGSALAGPWVPRVPVCPPAGPAVPPIGPGELPPTEPPPARHTLTIYNGPFVAQQNFVERDGAVRSVGEFKDYDVFFRDSPAVPWRLYGTYYSPRSAEDAAGVLRANGNLATVRPRCV